jgi:hypothetical protein
MSLLGLNASKSFSGTTTVLRLRGFRAVRADRFFAVNIPKPRNSTRSPRASAAVIVPSMASTMVSASRLYRCGFSAASFATSSDLIIRAQAFGSSARREQARAVSMSTSFALRDRGRCDCKSGSGRLP